MPSDGVQVIVARGEQRQRDRQGECNRCNGRRGEVTEKQGSRGRTGRGRGGEGRQAPRGVCTTGEQAGKKSARVAGVSYRGYAVVGVGACSRPAAASLPSPRPPFPSLPLARAPRAPLEAPHAVPPAQPLPTTPLVRQPPLAGGPAGPQL